MDERRYKVFELKNVSAPNFLMTPVELKDYIDFTPKRIYFLSHPQGEMKSGTHAHTDEEDELFVMVQGSATILLDDGHGLEKVKLSGPKQAVYVPKLVWHGFEDMSADAIILAVSSTNYDPERKGYFTDYANFQNLLKENGIL